MEKMPTQKTRIRLNLWVGCPHCHIAVFPDDSGFCPFCGYKIVGYSKEVNERWIELNQLRAIPLKPPQLYRFMIGDY
jgi:hypothetical protein